jgi:hypothetical protein
VGTRRLPMRKLREILRLKYERHLRHRAIARACGVGVGTVSEYVGRADRAGLTWPLPEDLDDAALEARLFAPPERARADFVRPDVLRVHQELNRPSPCASCGRSTARRTPRGTGTASSARSTGGGPAS